MKSYLTTISYGLIVLLFSMCNTNTENTQINNKDLGQNMIDMMVYHDNLGTELRKESAEDASWLLEGMDSSLQVIATKFDKHRKLDEPFEKTYRKQLQPSIEEMKTSLKENNFPKAISAYRILTKNCNSCHTKHNIDEEVLDLSDSSYK